jgi:hypothetical protein
MRAARAMTTATSRRIDPALRDCAEPFGARSAVCLHAFLGFPRLHKIAALRA